MTAPAANQQVSRPDGHTLIGSKLELAVRVTAWQRRGGCVAEGQDMK